MEIMASRKRILFLSESLSLGGQERSLVTLLKNIDTHRYDITLLSIAAGGSLQNEILATSDITFKTLLHHGTLLNKMLYKAFYNFLPQALSAKILCRGHYDMIVAFCEGQLTKWVSALPRRRGQRHQAWVHTDLLNNDWPVKTGVFKSIEEQQKAYDKYDSIIGVSKNVCNGMIKKYGCHADCIYNFIDFDEIHRKSLEVVNSKSQLQTPFNIISIGRQAHVKGYDRLLDALSQTTDIGLILVGDGAETPQLKHQATTLGINDRVVFAGAQSNPYPYLRMGDVYVCPSRHEGFNISIIEAMSLGLPVIATDCAGPREILGEDNTNGILCNVYDLPKQIINMREDKQLREYYRSRSLIRAQDFSLKQQLNKLYDTLQ